MTLSKWRTAVQCQFSFKSFPTAGHGWSHYKPRESHTISSLRSSNTNWVPSLRHLRLNIARHFLVRRPTMPSEERIKKNFKESNKFSGTAFCWWGVGKQTKNTAISLRWNWVTGPRAADLPHVWKVTGSKLSIETGCPDTFIMILFSTSRQTSGYYLKLGHDHFHIILNSLLIQHYTIWRYIIWS